MRGTRRDILALGGWIAAGGALLTSTPRVARAESASDERALGKPDAPVVVLEFFSLTCPHCAAFSNETLPQVRTNLIDTGKLRIVFNDFPLDRLALTAAMVARSLPPERYEPFCAALFASQDRWAYARGVNNTEELWKFAALAGMARPQFDAAISDNALREKIVVEQQDAVKRYHVDATPYFVFNGPGAKDRGESGERSYEDFAALVRSASAA